MANIRHKLSRSLPRFRYNGAGTRQITKEYSIVTPYLTAIAYHFTRTFINNCQMVERNSMKTKMNKQFRW